VKSGAGVFPPFAVNKLSTWSSPGLTAKRFRALLLLSTSCQLGFHRG
jgi:hypothetical protein